MNTITAYHAAQAIEAAELAGAIEIRDGLWLWTRDEILAAQATTWDEGDKAKRLDFSGSPYWLTGDLKPVAIYGADDPDLVDALQ